MKFKMLKIAFGVGLMIFFCSFVSPEKKKKSSEVESTKEIVIDDGHCKFTCAFPSQVARVKKCVYVGQNNYNCTGAGRDCKYTERQC